MALGQRTILGGERVAGSRIDDVRCLRGQQPIEAPCHKQVRTVGMEMGQNVFGTRPFGRARFSLPRIGQSVRNR
jgi:hypothetical protein